MLTLCPYCKTVLRDRRSRIEHLADPNGCPQRRSHRRHTRPAGAPAAPGSGPRTPTAAAGGN